MENTMIKKIKCELYNDNFQKFKRYNIPKAQLFDSKSHIESGSFYSTEYWRGSGRGLMTATINFEPYVNKAIEAWNRRDDNAE